jgi:hypothetical protein
VDAPRLTQPSSRRPTPEVMAAARAGTELPRPPQDFDEFVRWLGDLCDRLVLLEELPLERVEEAVRVVRPAVTRHAESPMLRPPPAGVRADSRGDELWEVLCSDHRWFEASMDEFEAVFNVVGSEDHGGNRQALGQYGRLLASALARHRRDEAEYDRLSRDGPSRDAKKS